MGKLHDLHGVHGQSPWLDNLRRDWLQDGTMARWIERGVRGCTSNPSIFQKAFATGDAYDADLARHRAAGLPAEEVYWELAKQDVYDALVLFRPLHDDSGGEDGHVSLEVAPGLAHDTAGTTSAARALFEELSQPNLMVKIPGTAAGIPAIRDMVAEGRSVNVTLIFGLDRYAAVMEAYLSGLEACEGDPGRVRGVASFFVSRVDTEVDRRLEAIATQEALALRGRAAVAQAKLAYQLFRETFSGERWERLARRGAHRQRPLWASTSTKNPAYSPTLYVDSLIGPDSVNTLPEATLEEFEATGTLARTVDEHVDDARRVFDALAEVGVDMADVAAVLEDEGVAAFGKAFDEAVAALQPGS